MSLETRLTALATAIGADVRTLLNQDGSLSALNTTAKNNLVAAINEVLAVANAAAGGGVTINDSAGNGNTTVTWSADKIFDELALLRTAVINDLTNGAATALDTLGELAAALGNDPNFATNLATSLSNRVRFDAAQTLTAPQQTQARANIGAIAAADVGNTERNLVTDYTTARDA
jgi:hypothetical protein